MAKKRQKNDSNLWDQPGLFDIFDDPADRLPVHPSIKDFVVITPEQNETSRPQTKTSSPVAELKIKDTNPKDDAILFMSFGSGSSGNCAFIGNISSGGFLLDAGVDCKTVEESLLRIGVTMDRVRGICLTHDHSDHVRFIYGFVRRNPHMKIFCTNRVLAGILRRHNISRRIKDYHKPVFKEFPFTIDALPGFEITAFDVPHDGSDNCGFFITYGNNAFTVATDLGEINDRVDYYARKAHYVMIESNYDFNMLRQGSYPAYLKARIAAANGHLDNEMTASFISSILSDRLSSVFLCHLSQDNNKPEIALAAINDALAANDAITAGRITAPEIIILPRYESSRLFTLRIKN
ncbi:MAG: MBL fold metallo-hydrolase [Paramuribaculum sp.]|nr:MBL fold metallo-hydrolase [Paramuribaculum sp.]